MPPLRAPSQFPPPNHVPRTGPSVASARRAPLVRTRGGQALSREAEELLFEHAELISEGSRGEGSSCGLAPHFFGTSMISIDMESACRALRMQPCQESYRAIASAVDGSVRVRIRAMRWARAEAARRIPEARLGRVSCEIRVHLREAALHIDVDLEAPIEVRSALSEA